MEHAQPSVNHLIYSLKMHTGRFVQRGFCNTIYKFHSLIWDLSLCFFVLLRHGSFAAASASGLWPFRGMACGATLKRPMEFEAALLSPGSPKRRRCAPLPGPTPGLRPPDAEPPPFQMQTPPASLQQPAPPGSERRLPTPGNLRCCCGLGRKPGRGVGGGEGAGVVGAGRNYLSTPNRPWKKKELGCC